jgi:hypothetical protein
MNARLVLGFSLCFSSLAGGCAPADEPSPAVASEDLTAREGYRPIENARGGVWVSMAVTHGKAYLGDNRKGIDILDPATMHKTGTVEGRVPADSLSASGDLLVACGDRDDRPLGWDSYSRGPDRNYVITVLDPRTGTRKYEVKLALQPYLSSSASNGFIDLPSMACRVDAETGTVSVSFSHKTLADELVTFALPPGEASHDFRDVPGAMRTPISGDGPNTIKDFSAGPRGLTFAAGGWGIRRVAAGGGAFRTLRDEGREHMVGVVESGDRLLAADHDGALRVLDADSGAEIEAVDVDDWVEALTASGGYVFVVGRKGVLVVRDRWSN